MSRTRGLSRTLEGGRPVTYPRCAAMAVGSVPFVDPQAAAEFILRNTPDIPTWPQLPRRSFLENMYVQFAEGLPGLVVDTEGERVWVTNEIPADETVAFLERVELGAPGAFAISADTAAGIPALWTALQGASPPFIKGQVTGPISFGLTVTFEDRRALLYDDTMREIVAGLLKMKARWQHDLLRRMAPGSTAVIVLDEPYLAQMGSAYVTIPAELCFPLLEECLEAIDCLAGLHVCGGADWERLVDLPLDLLSFDAADHLDSIVTQAEGLAHFVAEGGLLAWGAVPNDMRAFTETADTVARRVLGGAEILARAGSLALQDVLQASFVSPACGTGALPLEVAERCFEVAAQTSALLRERLAMPR